MRLSKISGYVRSLFALGLLLSSVLWGASTTLAASANVGAVYVLTNAAAGNSVLAYNRAANGSLSAAGSIASGGLGSGNGLGSQGAVVLSEDNHWLFAVNAGSDSVSVFAVQHNGLHLSDTIASGGVRPVSLTTDHGLLYVLNAGGSGNISGFSVAPSGHLSAIPGSTQPLSNNGTGTAPAVGQVQFSPHGDMLVVTEKSTNLLDTYAVGKNGVAGAPTTNTSAGTTPFGFAFGHNDNLIVSEAFGGAADLSAVSSYNVKDGNLNVVSASSPTHQTAACWIVVTNNGKYAYAANAGSGSISGYSVAHNGSLSLLNADGVTGVTGTGSSPADMALSGNSKYLYVLEGGAHAIGGFQVNADGSLTSMAGATGLPVGVVGIAAR